VNALGTPLVAGIAGFALAVASQTHAAPGTRLAPASTPCVDEDRYAIVREDGIRGFGRVCEDGAGGYWGDFTPRESREIDGFGHARESYPRGNTPLPGLAGLLERERSGQPHVVTYRAAPVHGDSIGISGAAMAAAMHADSTTVDYRFRWARVIPVRIHATLMPYADGSGSLAVTARSGPFTVRAITCAVSPELVYRCGRR
jgi:hypothetical protein